jgi:hypothetical protein
MKSNVHNSNVPKEIIDQALGKVNEAAASLDGYLYPLTSDDRQSVLKMGDKSLPFVEKTSELAKANPQFCPSYFNLDDLNIDLADVVNLRVLLNRLQQLTREVEDTIMLAGSEAYTQALSFYNAVKQAARDNVPGAEILLEELQKRFVKTGRPRKSVEE